MQYNSNQGGPEGKIPQSLMKYIQSTSLLDIMKL